MVSSKATTVSAYLAALPADRRAALSAVRKTILANLPDGFEEMMQHGYINYSVPLARFPDTYNKQPLSLAALASQKSHLALYLMGVYDDESRRWFEAGWRKTGKKLDMGKACVRFQKLEDLPLDLIGTTIARFGVDDYIERYLRLRPPAAKKAPASKKVPAPKKASKRPSARPSASSQSPAKAR